VNKRSIAGTLLLALHAWACAQPGAADAAEAAAAMKRAERLAANPLRVILEASRMKRRDAPAAEVPDTTPTAARPAAPGRLQALQTIDASLPSALPPLPREQVAVDLPMPVPLLQTVAVLSQAGAGRPRLVSKVDPEIPHTLRLQPGRVDAVQAELSLRTDGSVAEVVLLPPVPRPWHRYLREALLQWRFDPLAAATVHRVQLVFNDI